MGNLKKRQTHGPEKVSTVGQPGQQMEHPHAPKAPMQPGHRQVRKHPDPGAKHPHSPPTVQHLSTVGQPGQQGHRSVKSRIGGPSAPGLVVRQVGSHEGERRETKTHQPPAEGKRSASQVTSGAQGLRPNAAGSFFLGQVDQPRVHGKLGKLIRKMVGSSMHGHH